MLRCASSFVIATYAESRTHSSGLARLASGAFYEVVSSYAFYENIIFVLKNYNLI